MTESPDLVALPAPASTPVALSAAEINRLTGVIIECSIKVHRRLGPGLLEGVYHTCLVHELRRSGLRVEANVTLPVTYDELVIDVGYRADLIVEGEVIVELKSVEHIHPIHQAQLLSYMKLGGQRVGLLINFNVQYLKDGVTRVVNGLK
jgi:GxxExxY protein